ncbi:hypothetical protein GEMRC1_013492 [Eukaryota sp. GEM-RC1]
MQIIVDNRNFWNQVSDLLEATEPLMDLLNFVNGDKPPAGQLYVKCRDIYSHLQNIDPRSALYLISFEMAETFLRRWIMFRNHLHFTAFLLDPKNNQEHLSERDFSEGRSALVQSIKTFLPKQEQLPAAKQMKHYRKLLSVNSDNLAVDSAHVMESLDWWSLFGGDTPHLQKIATKILGIVLTASASERCWSIYTFIHSNRRNRLTPARARDLVFVYMNLQLLNKSKREIKEYVADNPEWQNLASELVKKRIRGGGNCCICGPYVGDR